MKAKLASIVIGMADAAAAVYLVWWAVKEFEPVRTVVTDFKDEAITRAQYRIAVQRTLDAIRALPEQRAPDGDDSAAGSTGAGPAGL